MKSTNLINYWTDVLKDMMPFYYSSSTIQRSIRLFWKLAIAELRIFDLTLQCQLFDALVKPVLSYGCEVWSDHIACE